jgi:tRNA G18 (ribose-2'-O)-methylase SpoU
LLLTLVPHLPSKTKKQNKQSYALVALEQTAGSRPLPTYAWPAAAVLILGREKEGVPPELLALADAALEVPQLGAVRSLNVAASAAVAVYSHAAAVFE